MSRRRRVTDDEENDTDHSSDSGVEDKPEVVNDEIEQEVIDNSIKESSDLTSPSHEAPTKDRTKGGKKIDPSFVPKAGTFFFHDNRNDGRGYRKAFNRGSEPRSKR